MIDLVEESLEIIGMSLFLYTLVEYLATLTSPAPAAEPDTPMAP